MIHANVGAIRRFAVLWSANQDLGPWRMHPKIPQFRPHRPLTTVKNQALLRRHCTDQAAPGYSTRSRGYHEQCRQQTTFIGSPPSTATACRTGDDRSLAQDTEGAQAAPPRPAHERRRVIRTCPSSSRGRHAIHLGDERWCSQMGGDRPTGRIRFRCADPAAGAPLPLHLGRVPEAGGGSIGGGYRARLYRKVRFRWKRVALHGVRFLTAFRPDVDAPPPFSPLLSPASLTCSARNASSFRRTRPRARPWWQSMPSPWLSST